MLVRRHALMMVVISAFVLIWGAAWGDFYVIPAAKRAKRTVLVSPKSTPAQSGSALLDALNAITDASSDKHYLVVIEPGRYDVGTNSLQMKPFVDIQGSGRYTTYILGAVEGLSGGVVKGASPAELRSMTVSNSNAGLFSMAINNNEASPRITDLKAVAHGSTYNCGISNTTSSAVLTHVEVIVADKAADSNIGIYNFGSVTMNHVRVDAKGGTANKAIYNSGSGPVMKDVDAEASGGDQNWAIYNLDVSDPMMTLVTAVAFGETGDGSDNRGVYNDNSNPVMQNVTASASGGNTSIGISSYEGDSAGRVLKLRDTVATAREASGSNKGISFNSILADMSNVNATASGASSSGLWLWANAGSYTIVADRCSFSGGTYAIQGDTEFTLNIGASKLDGGKAFGTYNCIHCYDENYAALNSTCD